MTNKVNSVMEDLSHILTLAIVGRDLSALNDITYAINRMLSSARDRLLKLKAEEDLGEYAQPMGHRDGLNVRR